MQQYQSYNKIKLVTMQLFKASKTKNPQKNQKNQELNFWVLLLRVIHVQEISTQNEKIGGYNLFQQLWHTSKLQISNEKIQKSEKKKKQMNFIFILGHLRMTIDKKEFN